MKLVDLLNPERILLDVVAESCEGMITCLVDALISQDVLASELRDKAISALTVREEEVGAGVGCGVAIPHAYLEEIVEPMAIFARSQEGISFGCLDNAPSKFVVLLLIPEEKKGQHLLTLSDVGKCFLKAEVRESISAAKNAEEILGFLA